MSPLHFYNTLAGRKELFRPISPSQVGLYVCGITPYDETHLGHARCYVVFDILKRVLEAHGYKVRHIQNFTDIDDKIIDRANKSNISPLVFAEPFIAGFHRWMKMLNVKPADEYPRVTQSIDIILELIEKLVQRGIAYESNGTVYYTVRKFPGYGKLSKRRIDELEAGARVETDANKKDPLDFALWKQAKPGEPSWPSPWGAGRPGWHIECSAMSMSLLGEEFDIHGGGQDLIFPHHENEVAQSEGATGKSFARLWMHNGFVTINQQKMSKSLGNFFTLKDILAQFDPMAVRYFLISQHYKSPLNFSDQELKAAESVWNQRISGAYRIAETWTKRFPAPKDLESKISDSPVWEKFMEALSDDLNTSEALGVLNQACGEIYQLDLTAASLQQSELSRFPMYKGLLDKMFDVLGLVYRREEEWESADLDLVARRETARKKKDWAEADRIRKELTAKGLAIEDTPNGPRLKRLV